MTRRRIGCTERDHDTWLGRNLGAWVIGQTEGAGRKGAQGSKKDSGSPGAGGKKAAGCTRQTRRSFVVSDMGSAQGRMR